MSNTMSVLTATNARTWIEQTREVPTPGEGEVLIRSRCVAVNNADVLGMDRADEIDEDVVAGYETAGPVVAVGTGVDTSLIDTLVAASAPASFAEYVVTDVRHTLPLPEDFPLDQAAALPTALLTEHGALRAGGFVPGQTVLVTGATSAIGLVGVQMAKALGARRVLASTRSADKADLLRRVGADEVVIGTENLAADVRSLTDDEGVDLVLEHVAGPVLTQAISATRKHGTVVQMGRLGGPEAVIDVDAVAFGRITIVGVSFGDADELAELLSTVREQLLPMVLEGRIRPVVRAVLPFAEANEAVSTIRANRAVGKIILALP
jgi:NADPH2:quinone reductase